MPQAAARYRRTGALVANGTMIGHWIAFRSIGDTFLAHRIWSDTSGLLAAAAAPAAGEEAPPSRDAVWRSIFARPVEASASAPIRAGSERSRSATTSFAMLAFPARRALLRLLSRPGEGLHRRQARRAEGLGGVALSRAMFRRSTTSPGRKQFFWDGRAPSLEAQARFPLLAPERACERLLAHRRAARGRSGDGGAVRARLSRAPQVSETAILAAIAAYERTLVSPPVALRPLGRGRRRGVDGDGKRRLRSLRRQGRLRRLPRRLAVHRRRLPRHRPQGGDPGRGAVEGGVPGLAQFKTPSLRELAYTAPYMHDGSLAGFTRRRRPLCRRCWCSARRSTPTSFASLILTEDEKMALISFLRTLSTDAGPPHRD